MTWVRDLSEIAGRFARDGCFHDVRPSTIARWTAWRLAHPGWRAPVRSAVKASVGCGKPAALAGALAAGLSIVPAAVAPHFGHVEYARGGSLARFTSAPPGGSRAVGGTFVPDPDSLADVRESRRLANGEAVSLELRPFVEVPEPASLAVLAVGALLAVWTRRRAATHASVRC